MPLQPVGPGPATGLPIDTVESALATALMQLVTAALKQLIKRFKILS